MVVAKCKGCILTFTEYFPPPVYTKVDEVEFRLWIKHKNEKDIVPSAPNHFHVRHKPSFPDNLLHMANKHLYWLSPHSSQWNTGGKVTRVPDNLTDDDSPKLAHESVHTHTHLQLYKTHSHTVCTHLMNVVPMRVHPPWRANKARQPVHFSVTGKRHLVNSYLSPISSTSTYKLRSDWNCPLSQTHKSGLCVLMRASKAGVGTVGLLGMQYSCF